MKKNILVIYMMAAGCVMLTAQTKNTQTLVPLTERVNVQADSARANQIIDGCWVAVGTNKPHAIQRDYTHLFDGKPSYRFELKTKHWKGMRKAKRRDVPNFHTAMQLLTISRDCRLMFIRKRRLQKLFITTERGLVRKEVPVTMSFRFIFLLLWTVMHLPSLPNGMECLTGLWFKLPRGK